MRSRLRERADECVDYQVARANDRWFEHKVRTLTTAGIIAWYHPDTLLDPACGDGSIIIAADRLSPIRSATLSDISVGSVGLAQNAGDDHGWVIQIEDAHDALAGSGRVDVVVLTEFLEHVPDPEAYLRLARQVGTHLVASSPLIEPPRQDGNPEHLWAFDNESYLEMLADTGWSADICQNLMIHSGYYNFQVWGCS